MPSMQGASPHVQKTPGILFPYLPRQYACHWTGCVPGNGSGDPDNPSLCPGTLPPPSTPLLGSSHDVVVLLHHHPPPAPTPRLLHTVLTELFLSLLRPACVTILGIGTPTMISIPELEVYGNSAREAREAVVRVSDFNATANQTLPRLLGQFCRRRPTLRGTQQKN